MGDLAWIEGTLVAARPQAVAALLRYFRDLDLAEEAFQDACLRALKSWPANGPTRDAADTSSAPNELRGYLSIMVSSPGQNYRTEAR